MARTVRLIGYWLGPDAPGWPDVTRFIDPAADPAEQQVTARYLRSGTVYVASGGVSLCRVCGISNGSTELTDGHLRWPEGLVHYIEAHQVRLPPEVRALMAGRVAPPVDVEEFGRACFEPGRVEFDDHWWREITSRQPCGDVDPGHIP